MHILVIDGAHIEAEFRQKFGPEHEYTFLDTGLEATNAQVEPLQQRGQVAVAKADVIFNFSTNSASEFLSQRRAGVALFEEATTKALDPGLPGQPAIFGFCGLPTLLSRPLLEVSLSDKSAAPQLAEVCSALGTDYRVVEDRVGLVTPRVICMIINEACFTVQEGTATMQDVDLGMKLGTNYPKGPFAWANAIGVARVYAVLEAVWHDTHDERYKVCPLLKKQALLKMPFGI